MYTKILKISLITLLLFVLLDILIGKNFYKKFIRKSFVDIDTSIVIPDKNNDHIFKKNYKTTSAGWGDRRYSLCTDNNGFRISCFSNQDSGRVYDIGIIGDSFTEAVGIEYEESYVGIIEKKFNQKKIANLAVSSYSPTIYFSKIKRLLNDGYAFKEIIVFLDLSDLHDDNVCYKLEGDKVKKKDENSKCYYENYSIFERLSNFSLNRMRLTYELFLIGNNLLIESGLKKKKIKNWVINNPRSNWTFDYKKNIFNNLELEDALKTSEEHMFNLFELLRNKNIDLSIVVYPWPGTIKYENDNNLHVNFWKNFCIDKCKQFINLQKPFFNMKKSKSYKKIYFENYIKGDVHFNESGNKIIAENFINLYKN